LAVQFSDPLLGSVAFARAGDPHGEFVSRRQYRRHLRVDDRHSGGLVNLTPQLKLGFRIISRPKQSVLTWWKFLTA
jgi:hypothetical protein